jgi:PAS domain S-box-containing protein
MALSNVQQARVIFEREQSYNKLRRINRLYQVHSTISRSAETARSAEELYRLACQTLVGVGDFRLAWIGQLEEDRRSVTPVAWAGEEWGYLSVNKVTAEDTPDGQGPVARAIRENRLICCNDIQADAHQGVWRDAALERGYQSVTSFPLRVEDRVVGALTVYSEEANFFDAEQTDLLREVSLTLSFSLTAMEKERTRREAEQALQTSEARYRRLFNNENDGVFVWPVGSQNELHAIPISEVNPAFCERMGYSAEELLQLHPLDIYPREERQTLHDNFLAIQEKGQALIETAHLTKDGRRFAVEINARLFEQDGEKYLLCISRDISGRKQAEEKIQRQLRRISALRSIDHAINTRLPLSKILSLVLDHAIEHLKVAAADIMIFDPQTQEVYAGYTKGFQTSRVEAERFNYVNHALADPRRLAHPFRMEDLSPFVHTSREAIMAEEGFCDFYGATLMSNNQLLGFIEVYLRCEPDEDDEWTNYFETLAGQAAIAISHDQMVNGLMEANQVLSRAYDETIEGWSRTMDLRDHDTEGHSERVTAISLRLGQALGLGEEDLLHMRWGALLHDIGKVGIPDGILLKPGPLNEDEWRIMKRHPQLAYDLLSPISFLRPALDIPFCHHEKWDGSGYPRGLKGEKIPLAARIFALADVWDALRSERPYRIGWSVEQTRAYIQSQIGLHFDPAIAEVFLRDINPE